jgi:MOSC domain-containing protein YiiM
VLKWIVRRPQVGQREVVQGGQLDLTEGLVGDDWLTRGAPTTADGSADPDCQVTIMNSRAIALLAQQPDRWALAGDQLYVDMDLSHTNVPAGTQLAIGEAVVLVTEQPHNGCKQFAIRFGKDAVRFVNSPLGKQLRLRGINARIVRPGAIRIGDVVQKVVA